MESAAEKVRSELTAIAAAIAVESPLAFTFAGRRFALPGERSPAEMLAMLLALLKEQLYQHCFCRRFTGSIEDDPPAERDDNFPKELSAANTGQSRWSSGWTIVGVEPSGKVAAQMNAVTRSFWPGEYLIPDLPASPPRIGASVRVHVGTASFTMQPGFFFVLGESLDNRQEGIELVRFYWSIEAAAAPILIQLLTERFNQFVVPFRFKCLTQRENYKRLDPAVLYVGRRFYRITAELASEVYARVGSQMRPASPLFTKNLLPGLALAEDPETRESFGMHRCGIVAEGLWEAHVRGVPAEQRLAVLEECFERHGLSLSRPYLNPGSIDDYDFAVAGGAA